MIIVVGMADMHVTKDPEAVLVSYALGSCLGITLYDPVAKIGGILHFMLPNSKIDPEKALLNPWMFADSGTPRFFKEAYKLGAEKERLYVKVIGGSQVMDDAGYFNIGKKNYQALRKIFLLNHVEPLAEDIGGRVNRTIRLEVQSGRVWIKTSGDGEKEL
jgi:chemotaxis protein CheD